MQLEIISKRTNINEIKIVLLLSSPCGFPILWIMIYQKILEHRILEQIYTAV